MRWLWLLLAILLMEEPAQAVTQNCTVSWNARSEADLAGYRIRWGTSSGNYTNTFTSNGSITSRTCAAMGITTPGTYFLVVNAFDNISQHGGNSTPERTFTLIDVVAPPTNPTITNFSPLSGTPGTVVAINGTNFSATLSSNTVKFNGVTATLSSGNTTQLVATVPGGAMTGPITVTVGANIATSAQSFTVVSLPPETTYVYADNFDGVQGPQWYFLDHTLAEMTYNAGASRWEGPYTYQTIYASGFHPGINFPLNVCGDSVIRFKAPASGAYNVSGSTSDGDHGGGDGVTITVLKNTTTAQYTRTIPNGGGNENFSFNVDLLTNDTLEFKVACPGIDYSFDSTNIAITIALSTPPPPVPPPPEPPPPVGNLVVSSLSPAVGDLFVGDSFVLNVALNAAPSADTPVTIINGSTNILAAPSSVTIPSGAPNATFTVIGLDQGEATITASLNSSTALAKLNVSLEASVGGPVLLSPSSNTLFPSTQKFVIVRWSAIRGVLRYELRVRDDTVSTENRHPACVGYMICETALIQTSFRVPVKPGHTYTWSVKWVDATSTTSAETTRSFAVNLNQ